MAYASTRLGHVAANQWEEWNLTNPTGVMFNGAIVVGSVSGATAIMVDYGFNFSFVVTSVRLLRYNGTAFNNGELCNVYTVNGGASVGTFNLAAGGASSTAIHPVVVVTGTDTANLFEYVYSASVAGGWGYHSTNNTYATLNCSIIYGDPFQAAAITGVSKNESVIHNGNFYVMGNSTYSTTFTMGEGTYGDVGSTRNGCVIDNDLTIAPHQWWGSCRYGKLNIYSSYINTIKGGWNCDLTNVTTYEAQNLGSIEAMTFPVSSTGYDGTEKFRLYNVSAGAGFLLAHGGLEFTDVNIGGNGSYGMIFFGPGDLTAENLIILNSVGITDSYGFIAQGTKTFVNCTMDETDVTGFWSNYFTNHKYTVDVHIGTEAGEDLQGATVEFYNTNDAQEFAEQTDASGDIAQQEALYAIAGSPQAYVSYNPFWYLIHEAGFRELIKENLTIDAPINYDLVMANYSMEAIDG